MWNAVDEASDGARSQLSADLADDDDEEDDAVSCSSSAAGNQSVNSAQCHDDNDDDAAQAQHQPDTAAAAAAIISDQYSVETLLANVQALLKLAMDSARHREQQASIKAGQSSAE